MTVLIEVKDYHIAKGRRKRCDACPVALAVKEKSKSFYAVGQDGITFIDIQSGDVKLIDFEIPRQARSFIQEYDAGKTPAPFSFELDIPEQYLKP